MYASRKEQLSMEELSSTHSEFDAWARLWTVRARARLAHWHVLITIAVLARRHDVELSLLSR